MSIVVRIAGGSKATPAKTEIDSLLGTEIHDLADHPTD
jgi:hypothetical protein